MFCSFVGTNRPGRHTRLRRCQLRLEALETRTVPDCTIGLVGHVLLVQCDDTGFNTVTVDHDDTGAVINGQSFDDSTYNVIQVNGGAAGTTTNLLANVKPVSVISRGTSDPINIGSAGSVQGIQAQVTLQNPPDFNVITVDDSTDPTGRTVTMGTQGFGGDSYGFVRGLAPADIFYRVNDVRSVSVLGGPGGNTFTVETIARHPTSGSVGVATTITTGGGGDVVRVQSTPPPSPNVPSLTINLGAGDGVILESPTGTAAPIQVPVTVVGAGAGLGNTITVVDQNSLSAGRYTVTDTSLFVGVGDLDRILVNYSNFDNLVLFPSGVDGTTVYDFHDPTLFTLTVSNDPPPAPRGPGDGAEGGWGQHRSGVTAPAASVRGQAGIVANVAAAWSGLDRAAEGVPGEAGRPPWAGDLVFADLALI
jgi:hypothetical protein